MSEFTRRKLLSAGVAGVGLLGVGASTRTVAREQSTSEDGNETHPVVGAWSASLHEATVSEFSDEGLADQTIRQVVRPRVGGQDIRIRLANTFGAQSVTFESVTVAVRDADESIVPETLTDVSFGPTTGVTIPPGARAYSDRVPIEVEAGQELAISFYAPGETGPASYQQFGQATAYVADGDETSRVENEYRGSHFSTQPGQSYYFVDGVDVVNPSVDGTVVTLGDSITNGAGTTAGEYESYPAHFSRRFDEESDRQVTVLNAGINGNRVLHDSPDMFAFGPSALERLDRDVLTQSGVTDVVVLEGINDIVHGSEGSLAPDQSVTADAIATGLRQIAARAHAQDVRVYAGTLPPFGGYGVYTEEGEQKRQAVNEFVRSSDVFDGVFDFDEVLRDPDEPTQLREEYDSGDHLHPSAEGYQAMAESIDLDVFGSGSETVDPCASLEQELADAEETIAELEAQLEEANSGNESDDETGNESDDGDEETETDDSTDEITDELPGFGALAALFASATAIGARARDPGNGN